MAVILLRSQRCEASVAYARRVLAEHRGASSTGRRFGRLGSLTKGADVTHGERRLVTLVSIAEEFSFGKLMDVTRPLTIPGGPFADLLWSEVLRRVGLTWVSRREAWNTFHEVKLKDCTAHREVDAFVEVRNSIMHGLGRLTWIQTRTLNARKETLNKLSRIDVSVDSSDRLQLRPHHLEECARCVIEFISSLDSARSKWS